MQDDPHFVAKNPAGKRWTRMNGARATRSTTGQRLHFVITWLEANLADMKVVAAGHRVVLAALASSCRCGSDFQALIEAIAQAFD